MKSKKVFSIICVVVLFLGVLLISNYIVKKENTKNQKYILPATEMISEKLEGFRAERYNEISSIMIGNQSSKERETVQEYIIASSFSLQGIEHIHIKVFNDEKGEMVYKFYNSEEESKGEFVDNKTFALDEEQTMRVLKVFEDNNFWDIPSKHPDETLGLDGYTVFIEGAKGNRYNIISMWCPDDKYEIKKICNEIASLAKLWGLSMNQ